MLYLEDFLELLESFPQELKERLTDIRDIDIKIQSEMDRLDSRSGTFLQQCKKQKPDWKTENYELIRKEYLQLLDKSDDKITISNQLSDLIDKYIKKLDQEIHKFKLELEADHAGITSKLEKINQTTINSMNASSLIGESLLNTTNYDDLINDEKLFITQQSTDFNSQLDAEYNQIYSPSNLNTDSGLQFNMLQTYTNMSQQQLQQNSANLLRSSTIQKPTVLHHHSERKLSHSVKRPFNARVNSPLSIEQQLTHHKHRNKKMKLTDGEQYFMDGEHYDDESGVGIDDDESDGDASSTTTTDKQYKEELSEDQTNEEQRYCVCKDVSYGDMILCDNRRCDTQWFHFTCVNLSAAPKGKWYCPQCQEIKKKKKDAKIAITGNGGGGGGTSSSSGISASSLFSSHHHSIKQQPSIPETIPENITNEQLTDFETKFQPKLFNTIKQHKQQQQQQHPSNDDVHEKYSFS